MRVAHTKKLTPLFLDFETFWSQEFTLRTIPTGDYIRDKRFKVHCVAAKVGKKKTRCFTNMAKFKEWLDTLDWDNIVLVGHNLYFDGLILTELFDVVPAAYHCTMSMSRGLWRNTCAHGLDPLCHRLGLKGKEKKQALVNTKGKEFLTREELDFLCEYCIDDVDDTAAAYEIMLPYMPEIEMEIISHTVRCFTEPLLEIDADLLDEAIEEVMQRRDDLLDKIANFVAVHVPDVTDIAKAIRSRIHFPAMLEALGVEVPMKVSPRTGKPTYALAAKDPEYMALTEHDDDMVRLLCEVRSEFSSNQTSTRAQRLLSATQGGATLPVMYLYCGAHTMRWSASGKMNLQNLQRGSKLRRAILAPKGHVLMVGDSAQIEARFTAWIAGQWDLVEAFRQGRDVYSEFATDVFGRHITKADETERFVGKTCIAAGSLVLTDKGLIPIENVSLGHKLWDGVEWVSHDGVIYQGYKEVITYDGLTATPDHQVHTEGRSDSVPFGQAASEMARLVSAGAGRQAIRVSEDYKSTHYPEEWVHNGGHCLHELRCSEADQSAQLGKREVQGLPVLLAKTIRAFRSIGTTLRRYKVSVRESVESSLRPVRWPWHPEPVQVPDGVHTACGEGTSSLVVQGCGDRPHRQQWALRAGQSSSCDKTAEYTEPEQYGADLLATGDDSTVCVPLPLQLQLDVQARTQGDDGGADHGACKAHVYDILNAGPRHRFTVQNKLVLNCILGLGFGMGHNKLHTQLFLGGVEMPVHEVKRINTLYRTKYDKIPLLWQKMDQVLAAMAAGGSGTIELADGELVLEYENDKIWMPNGLALHYPGLRNVFDEEGRHTGYEFLYVKGARADGTPIAFWKKIYGGLLTENIVQCLARIAVSEQMVDIARRYRVVMTTHDEIVMLVQKNKEAIAKAQAFMEGVMGKAPAWCGSLPVSSEVKYADNYSK